MAYGNRYSNMISRRVNTSKELRVRLPQGSLGVVDNRTNYVRLENMFPAFVNSTRNSYLELFGEGELAECVREYFDTQQVSIFVNNNGEMQRRFKQDPKSFDIANAIKAEFYLMVDDDKSPNEPYRYSNSAPLYLVVARNIEVVSDLVRMYGMPMCLHMDYFIPNENNNGCMAVASLKPLVDAGTINREVIDNTMFNPITNGGHEMIRKLYNAWNDLRRYAREKEKENGQDHRTGVPQEIHQHAVPDSGDQSPQF